MLKYSAKDSPHLTIETNLSCNIHCRSCYNINNTYVKKLEQIYEEIEIGSKKRNLQSITLIGGEPTLHPDLVSIIKYISAKGIICQMLTNGILFLQDGEDVLLGSLVDAGLDKILLHVDEGQAEIHEDLSQVIETLFTKFEKQRVFFSLSTTVFPDTQKKVSGKIRKYAGYKYFDGILALLSRNCEEAIQPGFDELISSTLLKEYEGIYRELGINPVAYIPTSLDDKDISWLFYFFYINSRTGAVFCRSTALVSFFFWVYRIFAQKAAFSLNFRGWVFYAVFILSSIVELLINPLRVGSLVRLVSGSQFLSALRIHTLVVQNPPEYHPERKQFHICHHCPDATIRNGMLTPLCLADIINPLPQMQTDIKMVPPDVHRTVYEHMEEIL